MRDRQPILTIPDLSRMQVTTSVHESVVNRIKKGLPATIRLDAFSDIQFDATVDSVAVLADPGGWMSSDTKVYKAVVKIDQEIDVEADLVKPGMTAVVEMHVDHLTDVLCVPVQAVVERGSRSWCYVNDNGAAKKCLIEHGRTNDKLVEICSGLEIGDQVILNPSALLVDGMEDEQQTAPDDEVDGEADEDAVLD